MAVFANFVVFYNVDFRFRWTLSAGVAWASSSLLLLRGLKSHAFPAGVATLRSNQLSLQFYIKKQQSY